MLRPDTAPPAARAMRGEEDFLSYLVARYLELGPVFRVEQQGAPLTVITGPEGNLFVAANGGRCLSSEELWRDMHREFGLPPRIREGESHRRRHLINRRFYARRMLDGRVRELMAIAGEVTAGWRPAVEIDLLLAMQRVVGEQLGGLLIGHGPGEHLDSFLTMIDVSKGATLSRCLPKLALLSPEYVAAKRRSLAVAREVVAAHVARPAPAGPRDLVDAFLDAVAAEPEEFVQAEVTAAALSPFFAGLDTVPPRSAFLLQTLRQRPDVLARVVAEVDRTFAGGHPSASAIMRMPDLRSTVMEVLRLCMPLRVQRCVATATFTVAGCRIEAGEDVAVVPTVSHFLPHLFADPQRFDVDRYRPPRDEHRPAGAWAPFGVGVHSCPGGGIAELLLMVNSAAVLRDFRLLPPEPGDDENGIRVASRPAGQSA